MRTRTFALVVTTLLTFCSASVSSSQSPDAATVVDDFVNAWNSHDMGEGDQDRID